MAPDAKPHEDGTATMRLATRVSFLFVTSAEKQRNSINIAPAASPALHILLNGRN